MTTQNDEDRQVPERGTESPAFRFKAAGRKDQIGPDGALYRVHLVQLVDEAGKVVTDETDEGSKPIVFQSVPMRISKPVRAVHPSGGIVLH